MSEIIPYAASGVIGALSGTCGAYAIMKLTTRNIQNKILPIIDDLTPVLINKFHEYLNSTEGQKAIYQVGILVGNGAKDGLGIAPQGKSPKGLMGLIGQFLPNILQGFASKAAAAAPEASNTAPW